MKIPTASLLTSIAIAQNAPGISTNPGGAIPAGVRQPNLSGFGNADVSTSRGGYAICVSGNVQVTASAQNIKMNIDIPTNQSQVTQAFVSLLSAGANFTQRIASGTQQVSGTYNITSTMCLPANGTTYSTVQFLTHGIGFDRYYWDWAPGYSYVDYAAMQGYATFSYDRLGVGSSSKPDPIQIVQSPLEIEIAAQLISGLRNGQFGGMNFTHVVGTGHSFGSVITQGVTVRHPTLLDAAVLTGFTTDATGMPAFLAGNNFVIASQNQPYRFSALNNGYLVTSNPVANQFAFFHAPGFDPNQVSLADATKGTVTMGELFTSTAVVGPATNYTGAVASVLGDADLPFCAGNCAYPRNLGATLQPTLYPRAKNVTNSVFIQPMSGHGMNLHYTATQSYQFIQDFIQRAGLAM